MEAGEVVYQGREGTGGAQIFRNEKSTLPDFMARQQALKANQAQRRQALEIQTREHETKALKEYYDRYEIDKNVNPLREPEIKAEVGNFMGNIAEFKRLGVDPKVTGKYLSEEQQRINRLVAFATKEAAIGKEVYDRIKSDPALNQEEAFRAYRDATSPKLLSELTDDDFKAAQSIPDSGEYLNRRNAIGLTLKGIDNQVSERRKAGEIDTEYGKYFVFNGEDKKFKTGTDGKYDPGLINHVLESDPRILDNIALQFVKDQAKSKNIDLDKNQIQQYKERLLSGDVAKDPIASKKWNEALYKGVAEEVDQYQQLKKTQTYQPQAKASGRGPTPDQVMTRDQTIRTLQRPFGSEGELSDVTNDASQMIGSLVGAKYAGKTIEEAIPVKAGMDSGRGKNGEPDIKYYDRYILNVRSGTGMSAMNEDVDINLSDGNYSLWNDILNTSPAFKEKIDTEKLLESNKGNKSEEKIKIKNF